MAKQTYNENWAHQIGGRPIKVKPIDGLQPVKIGNTTFWLKPGTDIEAVKQKYAHILNPK